MKKFFAVFHVLLMLLALTACGSSGKYQLAMERLTEGEFDEAKAMFEELGDYENSASMAMLCDYEKAGSLADKGDYEAALELFEELGKFEDSLERADGCRYSMAEELLNNGNAAAALTLFEELGDYEDSREQVKTCRYAMALEAYENGDVEEALALFRELGDYEDSAEFCANMSWDVLRDYILKNGSDSDGMFILRTSEDKYTFYLAADENEDHLYLFAFSTNNVLAEFYHDLMIDVVRGEDVAEWQSMNTMVMNAGGRVGTNEENRSGTINIAGCDGTSTEDLALESYSKYAVDIYGNVTRSDSLSDASMNDTGTHYRQMIHHMGLILVDTGLGITLADIGFKNLNG